MDKRINQRVDEYIIEFKRAIKGKVAELGLADNDVFCISRSVVTTIACSFALLIQDTSLDGNE